MGCRRRCAFGGGRRTRLSTGKFHGRVAGEETSGATRDRALPSRFAAQDHRVVPQGRCRPSRTGGGSVAVFARGCAGLRAEHRTKAGREKTAANDGSTAWYSEF